MALQDSPRIRIHDEHRMLSRIKEYRIRSLWSNAIQFQQFVTKLFGWLRKHSGQGTAIAIIYKRYKSSQAGGFLSKIARRSD